MPKSHRCPPDKQIQKLFFTLYHSDTSSASYWKETSLFFTMFLSCFLYFQFYLEFYDFSFSASTSSILISYLKYGGRRNSGSDSQSSFLLVILFNHIIKTPGFYINSMQINFRSSALTSPLSFRLSNSITYQNCFPNTFIAPQTQKL